jgi:two-component system, NtrC family, response regulator HydG
MREGTRSDSPTEHQDAKRSWGILIADDDRRRREALANLIARAFSNVSVRAVAVFGGASGEEPPLDLALVAVTADGGSADAALALIACSRARGAMALAFASSLEGWTLAQKCRPLIAGAARVLDGGAADFEQAVRTVVGGALGTLEARRTEEQQLRQRLRAMGVVGESPQMIELFRKVLRLGPLSDLSVLVTGETGTGKERFTQALHQSDPKRSRAPLIAVNCAALAPNLAESELFGHRRGAFTGAERARPGLVRAAHGGVLFLDEIGELDLMLQSKLLRVLQEGRVLGVGEESETAVDVRVIAATNRDLKTMVAAGRFRADLFHRLGVLGLELPPLRGRMGDIASLTRHFLEKYRGLNRAARHEPSRDFVDGLCRHPLPGNVRQLENLVRQALVHKADDTPLALADLPIEVLSELAQTLEGPAAANESYAAEPQSRDRPTEDLLLRIAEDNDWNLGRCVRACEREVLAAALRRAEGNQTKAATLLGVTARSIYNKMRKLGLHE